MRLLLTGGNGYIGRFCLRRLVAAGHAVVVLDRRPPPGDLASAAEHTLIGDIADRPLLERLLARHRIEAVLHLAAEKSVAESMADPGGHLQANVCGSLALLEAMRRQGVDKVVFSSSAAVYGTPDHLPVDERSPTRPDNPYGAGKLMVEEVLHWYGVAHRFDSISLRFFNAAGAAEDGSLGDSGHGDNLIPRVMDALTGRAGPVPVYGTDFPTPDGTAVRDYIHVEDLADAHVRAVELLSADHCKWLLNLGTGRGHSVREVLAAAERASRRQVPSQDAARRVGDPAASWADPSLAHQVLGWQATRGLDDIMTSAWLWEKRRIACPR